jgi:hypothetical protein
MFFLPTSLVLLGKSLATANWVLVYAMGDRLSGGSVPGASALTAGADRRFKTYISRCFTGDTLHEPLGWFRPQSFNMVSSHISFVLLALLLTLTRATPAIVSRAVSVSTPLGTAQGTLDADGANRFAVRYANSSRWAPSSIVTEWQLP